MVYSLVGFDLIGRILTFFACCNSRIVALIQFCILSKIHGKDLSIGHTIVKVNPGEMTLWSVRKQKDHNPFAYFFSRMALQKNAYNL